MKKLSLLLVMMLPLALVFSACVGGQPAEEQQPAEAQQPVEEQQPGEEAPAPVTILVAAAASLENAYVEALIPAFQAQYDWITVEGAYDASGKLQTQIEEGLAADVFMSAANKQMNALVDGGKIASADVVQLLLNEVVLIEPAAAASGITAFADVLQADTIAIGDPESVPVGQYAQEIFTNLGIIDQVLAKASLGTNVTEVLNWVAEGSADLGVVYATDAASMADQVKVIATAPADALKTPVIYPVAVLAGSANREAAQLFVDFLRSDEAMAVFESYGFKSNL